MAECPERCCVAWKKEMALSAKDIEDCIGWAIRINAESEAAYADPEQAGARLLAIGKHSLEIQRTLSKLNQRVFGQGEMDLGEGNAKQD